MPVLFLTVFIDFVGFGIIIPALPFFGLKYGASPTEVALLFAIYSTVQVFASPVWGRLSDRIGRRPVLLMTLAGASGAYIVFGFADSLAMLFVGRALSGLMAGNMSVAHAIIADMTSPEERANGMGKLGAATASGFVVGPLLGSVLVGSDPAQIDQSFPAFVAAAMSGFAVALGMFRLPESLPAERRAQRDKGEGQAKRPGLLAILAQPRMAPLVIVMMIISYVVSQMTAVFPLWTQARLGWGPREMSYLFASVGVIIAVIQGKVVGTLTRLRGEPWVLLVGAVATIAGLALIIPSNDSVAASAAIMLAFVGTTLCMPVTTSLISRQAPPDQQGGILGGANSAASIGRIIGPPVGGLCYQFLGPGAPFGLAALFVVYIAGLAIYLMKQPARIAAPGSNCSPSPPGEDG